MRQLAGRVSNFQLDAVVQGGSFTHGEFTRRVSSLQTGRIDDLNVLEKQWLTRPYERESLREYEKLLGANIVNRIIQSDRLVGWKYIRGGVIPKTPLADICENDENQYRYIYGLLDYLFQWFRDEKPNIVFTYAVAGAFTLALSLVAKHFGVEYRRLHEIRLGNRCILDSSVINMADPLRDFYHRAREDENLVADVREQARAQLNKMREKPELPDYHVLTRKAVLTLPPLKDFAALLWRTMTRRPPDSLAYPYHMKRFYWELRRYLKARQLLSSGPFEDLEPLFKDSFVYYPLQYDPEATTMVLAPHATNQLTVIEALAKSIPAEWKIVVKDHYTMLGRRPGDFYKRLKEIPKVHIVSPAANTFDLIRACEMVAVVTGTAGWEAMQMGKRVLCMGPAHYQNVDEGFVYETNFSQLAEAVERALSIPPASDRALELYLACMIKGSFPLPAPILNDVSISDQYLEEQVETIDAIVDGLVGSLASSIP